MVSQPSKPAPLPPPPPPPPPPKIDEAELARQRKSLEARRRGRRTLRIEPGLASPAGATGLRIPEAAP